MYELRCDPALTAIWDSLPDAARTRLAHALAAVCEDPLATTQPYGIDDGVTRQLILDDTIAILLITPAMKRVRMLQISYLG
ncbi:hypothetical protein [Streptomyces noursei]|uniref:hypothetical protein n=1 Tax=Streptomyces noursei TaxID=1971 RepID=UPI001679E974|nr:hypothetical protein [Streptomyces noursei]MCZ1013995.1 hypothetical protein [Streptomyces noursei]GGX40305.1 hypothetical protein GCM10010341_72750 [Streptomyces noursei]